VVTLVVRVDSPLVSGTVIYNAVAITDTAGLTDTDEVTTPVESAHSLSITKTADPAVVQAGGLLTYTLAWAVSGNEPAFGVTISDTVPVSTTYQACYGGLWCGLEPGGVVTWSLGTVNPPASGVVTLVVRVDSPLVSGTVIYNAVAITDTAGLTDTDEVTTPVESAHSLSITKTADPAVVQAGGLLTYTLAWAVSGNEPAFGVTISDTVPVSTTYQACYGGLSCGYAGGVVTWSLGTVNPPASGVVTLVVRVDSPLVSGTVIYNAVAITDTAGLTDTDEVTTPVESAHSLSITKTADPAVVQAGGLLTYTLAWAVSGNEPAFGVTISDTVPVSTTYQACYGGLWCGLEPGGVVTWYLNTVNPPASGVVTLVVRVDSPLVSGTVIYNAVAITDTAGLTDTDEVTTPVESAHSLSITKTADPAVVQAGGLLTYTLAWAVSGNEPAFGVTISDTVPVSTTYQACYGGLWCGLEPGGVVTWYLNTVNPPASGVVTLVVRVDSPLVSGTVIYNAVAITDTAGLTDTDEVTTPVESAHSLSITKTADPAVVQAGGLLTYTLAWAVSGNEPAFGVTISDTVPVSTTYQACYGGLWCGLEPGGVVTWSLGTVNPPASGVVTLVVRVDSPLVSGTVIYNAVAITDTAGLTDTDEVTTPVESAHSLSITKTADPAVVQAGGLLTYTLAWAVSGNEPAFGVTISDTVPVSTTYQACYGGLWCGLEPGGVVTWYLGTVNPPASGVVTLVVRVDSPLVSGTVIYNAVAITDTAGLTDTDEVTTPVESAHSLSITKTADPAVVQAGGLLTYTLAWAVSGNEPAFGVTISDTVPVSTTYQACYGGLSCGYAGGVVTWSLGTVNPPASGVVTLVVRVDSPLVSGTVIYNAVAITDTAGLTDTDEVTTPVESAHSLSITKTADPAVVQAGGLLTYTLAWAVSGNEPAFGVTISDTVPVSTTYQACYGGLWCGLCGRRGHLEPGDGQSAGLGGGDAGGAGG
jgi:uncharacterized repeat protein (TIGR01451 family)